MAAEGGRKKSSLVCDKKSTPKQRISAGAGFCIGLGDEPVPFLFELVLESTVVLDNAVVYYGNTSCAVLKWMSVFFAGFPMRCPTRMSESICTIDGRPCDQIVKIS